MRGTSTKIITPRSIVPKKISFNVHPSHEAAARKANQNISKLVTPSELAQKRLQRTRLVNDTGTLNVPSIPRSTPSPNPSVNGSTAPQPQQLQPPLSQGTSTSLMGSVPNLPPMPQAVPIGPIYPSMPTAAGHMNASAAAQQIAAGMMRSGMMRPPGPSQNSSQQSQQQQQQTPKGQPTNSIIAQLQQLQQLQQIQMQNAAVAASQFADSPSKNSQSFRPSQQQSRPPAMNFMNLPPGITPLQLQQLQQQKQAQANHLQQQQQQQLQAAQLQQMYAKTMQSRPPNPSSTPSESNSEQQSANNSNVRTSPRKSSNK